MTVTATLLLPEFPKAVGEEAGKGIGEAIAKQSLVFVIGGLVVVLVIGLTWISLLHRRLTAKHEREAEERRASRVGDQEFMLKVMDRVTAALEKSRLNNNNSNTPSASREVPGAGQALDGQAETTE